MIVTLLMSLSGDAEANSLAALEKISQINITSGFINFNLLLKISAFFPIKLPIVTSNKNKSKKKRTICIGGANIDPSP